MHKIRSEPLDAHTWDRPHIAATLSRGAQLRQEKIGTPQPNSRRRTNQQRIWRCTASNVSDVSRHSTLRGRRLAPVACLGDSPRKRELGPATLTRHELGVKGSPLWSCRGWRPGRRALRDHAKTWKVAFMVCLPKHPQAHKRRLFTAKILKCFRWQPVKSRHVRRKTESEAFAENGALSTQTDMHAQCPCVVSTPRCALHSRGRLAKPTCEASAATPSHAPRLHIAAFRGATKRKRPKMSGGSRLCSTLGCLRRARAERCADWLTPW